MPTIANHQMSCTRCMCNFLCPPFPSSITSKIAFIPPEPTYNLVPDSQYQKYEIVLSRNVDSTGTAEISAYDVWFTKTQKGNRIVVLNIKCPSSSKYTIIYSHGNHQDLGTIHRTLVNLVKDTGCDVVSYDYTGYGRSNGRASEAAVRADIEAVWTNVCLRNRLDPASVILYGYSIGSVPTIHLAASMKFAGVILQAPIASSKRMLCRSGCFCDTMNNLDKLPKITSPVLVIHGMKDTVIDIRHGRDIYDRCTNAVEPLWVAGAGHDDVEVSEVYKDRLNRFISEELAT